MEKEIIKYANIFKDLETGEFFVPYILHDSWEEAREAAQRFYGTYKYIGTRILII